MIKKNDISKIIVLILILMQFNFFYILPIGDTTSINMYNTILITIFFLVEFAGKTLNLKNYDFSLAIVSLMAVVILSSLYSFIQYPSVALGITKQLIMWIACISLYYPLSQFLTRNYTFFINIISSIGIIYFLIFFLQSILYSVNGTFFLQKANFINNYGFLSISVRLFGPRLLVPSSFFIFFVIIISLISYYITKQNKHIVCFVLGFFYLFIVDQTRVMMLVMLIVVLFGGFFIAVRNLNLLAPIKSIIFILLVIIIIYVFGGMNLIRLIIDNFSSEEQYASTRMRQEAFNYFFQVITKHPFFGNGIYIGSEFSKSFWRARGPIGSYFYSDLGFIGNLAQFGIIIIIPIFLILKKAFQLSKNIILLIPIALFCLEFTSLSWIHFGKIICLVILLSLLTVIKSKNKSTK